MTIVVNDVAPSSLTYSPNSFTLTKGTAMTTVSPSLSGGTVTSWSVSPSCQPASRLIPRPVPSAEHPPPLLPRPPTRSGQQHGGATRRIDIEVTMSHHRPSPTVKHDTLTKGTAMTTVANSEWRTHHIVVRFAFAPAGLSRFLDRCHQWNTHSGDLPPPTPSWRPTPVEARPMMSPLWSTTSHLLL